MGIGFFTPVKYGNQATSLGQKLTEFVDDYFYLGGRIAQVTKSNQIGSEPVVLKVGKTVWWKTALKVISYTTLIVPMNMLIAKAALRSYYAFYDRILVEPFLCPHHLHDYPVGVKAPLTLVRSSRPVDLRISVLFNHRCRPQEPIVPQPTEILTRGPLSKYSWDVLTHQDGTMTVHSMDGRSDRVSMIWWEAQRKDTLTHLDTNQAVCVKRGELKEFLGATLKKMGVQDKELSAFTHYWHETFKNDYEPQAAPFVLVQPVKSSELRKYLPDMQVEGKEAGSFVLNRFYFRFEPVSRRAGISAASYIGSIKPNELGPNAVIDLGGEVVETQVQGGKWEGSSAFQSAFIKEHIYPGFSA